jgi:hypothetical protein
MNFCSGAYFSAWGLYLLWAVQVVPSHLYSIPIVVVVTAVSQVCLLWHFEWWLEMDNTGCPYFRKESTSGFTKRDNNPGPIKGG